MQKIKSFNNNVLGDFELKTRQIFDKIATDF